jgi:hypothetical protein
MASPANDIRPVERDTLSVIREIEGKAHEQAAPPPAEAPAAQPDAVKLYNDLLWKKKLLDLVDGKGIPGAQKLLERKPEIDDALGFLEAYLKGEKA